MMTAKRVGVAAGVLALALAAWQVWRFRQAIAMVRRVNELTEQTEIIEGVAEREGQDRLIAAILDAFLPGRYYWGGTAARPGEPAPDELAALAEDRIRGVDHLDAPAQERCRRCCNPRRDAARRAGPELHVEEVFTAASRPTSGIVKVDRGTSDPSMACIRSRSGLSCLLGEAGPTCLVGKPRRRRAMRRAHPETKIARVATGSAAPRRAELGRAHPILIPRGGTGHAGLISNHALTAMQPCVSAGRWRPSGAQ